MPVESICLKFWSSSSQLHSQQLSTQRLHFIWYLNYLLFICICYVLWSVMICCRWHWAVGHYWTTRTTWNRS